MRPLFHAQVVEGINSLEDLFTRLKDARLAAGGRFDFRGARLHVTSNWEPPISPVRSSELERPKFVAQLKKGTVVIANATILVGSEGVVELCGSSEVEFDQVHFQGELVLPIPHGLQHSYTN